MDREIHIHFCIYLWNQAAKWGHSLWPICTLYSVIIAWLVSPNRGEVTVTRFDVNCSYWKVYVLYRANQLIYTNIRALKSD